jgi:phosphoribosyl-ATP pyrophosphohydrolase
MSDTPQHDDPLRRLIDSTLAFYARFGVEPEHGPAEAVFREEVAELIEAAADGTNKTHIAEEAADVLVTVVGLCVAVGVPPEQLIEQVHAVAAKNDAKTHETHAVNANGKIARRR